MHTRWVLKVGALGACMAAASAALAQEARIAADESPPITPVPVVSDPMLAPPREAPVTIASWADAIARVRAQSPRYAADSRVIARAEAQARLALSALLPLVAGQAALTHNFTQLQIPFNGAILVSPPENNGTLGATVTWTPLNPRAIYDYETARRGVDQATLDFTSERRQIAIGVVSAMLATLSAARVADLNRVGLRSSLERLRLTETRLAFGQGTPLDVDRASKDVAAARRLIIDGDEQLKRVREALGSALGSGDPIAVATTLDLEGFEHAVASTCRLNDRIEERPDVLAARKRLELAHRATTSAELAPLPTIGVQSAAQYNTEPVLAPKGTFSVSALLTVPFYDGGYRYGQLRDARAAEEQARAHLEETKLAAIFSAARAKRAVEVARADRDVSKSDRDLAAQIDLRTREAYVRGRGTSLDLVTSAEQLRVAEINLAFLDFQLAQARATTVLENAECTY
jgi:outer membrane protein, multidrug efflux system